eukprot:357847-Chlamydomonas_euryale.AAC.7
MASSLSTTTSCWSWCLIYPERGIHVSQGAMGCCCCAVQGAMGCYCCAVQGAWIVQPSPNQLSLCAPLIMSAARLCAPCRP